MSEEAVAALQRAISTWPQHLTRLAALDLGLAKLDAAATTALLYDTPSLTSLCCCSLSAPAQHTAVSQLRKLKLHNNFNLSELAPIKLGPQCSLDLGNGLGVYPGGELEALLLRTAARNSLHSCEIIYLRGSADDDGQPMGQEASARMVGALAAGLAGAADGCKITTLRLDDFILRRDSAAALVGFLQAAPLVDSLAFW